MRKVIDITEKLKFEESPILKVKNIEIRVNDDAPTMLKVMSKLGENVTPKVVAEMYELLIPESDRKKIDKLKLRFEDFQILVESAISLVTGEEIDDVNLEE